MKRMILLFGLLLGLVSLLRANDVYQSTSTTVALDNVSLCNAGKRGFLHGICTDFAVAASSMTVYNSSWTTSVSKIIGPVGTTAEGCRYYDTDLPAGILYRKTNAAAVTILYRCQ